MPKNIVICLDGTANEPEREHSNVARTFDLLIRDPDRQVTYYDPGVGTMGDRAATSRLGQLLTRWGGVFFGHGVQDNIAEAYQFLMSTYEDDDKVFIFGFSRGAYTARALAGLLRTTGLLEPGAVNLVPYAMKLYTGAPDSDRKDAKADRFWKNVQRWENTFANPGFRRMGQPVHFLGVWDTVKFVGWLNLVGRFRQVRWPFTRNLDSVAHGRHAVSIDERRRQYGAYLFEPTQIADPARDFREVWFAGVHSDVGGGFVDQDLANITLKWMIDEAVDQGLLIRPGKYKNHVKAGLGEPLAPGVASGEAHPAGLVWFFIGLGWSPRQVPHGALLHRTVEMRIADSSLGYRPRLDSPTFVDR